VIVTLTPPSDASLVTVRLFNGNGAGVYFEFSTFSFHVPSVLSAPKAATVVIARAISALVRIVRICQAPLNFVGRGCLRSQGAPATTPLRHPLAGNLKPADRSKQHSRRSALGRYYTTSGSVIETPLFGGPCDSDTTGQPGGPGGLRG